jgi:hypothetical protein
VGWQVHAGGGHAGADSTVKMITHEAAVHCCALKDMTTLWAAATFMSLGDAPQRHRGPHLGGSSSVRWSSRTWAGLLFTRYPFLLRTQVAHATRKPKRSITIDRVKKPYNYKVSVPWLARWAR